MLNQEKINLFNQLLTNNQAPAPEDSADFEMYKALLNSQAMAANSVAVSEVQTSAPAAIVPAPLQQATPPAPIPTMVMPSNGRAFTMEDLMSTSMAADKYLKVKYQQTFIGSDIVANNEIYAVVNLDEVITKLSIKGGSPVRYAATVDGKTCTSGGSWLEAVSDIQKVAPTARPYNCVDIPFKIAKEIKNFNNVTICEVGEIVGHTTSTTNWKNWLNFYRSIPEGERVVFVKVSREDVNKNNNQWGLLKFEYVSNEQAKALGLVA